MKQEVMLMLVVAFFVGFSFKNMMSSLTPQVLIEGNNPKPKCGGAHQWPDCEQ